MSRRQRPSAAADRSGQYAKTASQLDDHIATCPGCSRGIACADGDGLAEAEYRTWRRATDNDGEESPSRRRG